MSELLRKYLLSTAAAFAPRGGRDGARAAGDEDGDDTPAGDEDGDETPAGDEDGDETPAGDEDGDETPAGDEEGDETPLRAQDEPRGGRAGRDIARLREERRAAVQRAEEAERRLAEREVPRSQQPQMSPQEEQAVLATMTAEERMEYRTNKLLTAQQQQNNQLFAGMRDQTDKAAFGMKLAEKPHLKRLEAEVEQRYARVIKEGGYLPREAILIYVLGEKAYASQANGKPRQDAQRRVARQQTRPTDARGDTQQPRRGGKTLEDRLDGVAI